MIGKLFDSERRGMECLWDEGELSAKEIAERLNKKVGWSKTTTYTIIRKCVEKEAVERREPGFICHPLISRERVQEQETEELIQRNFEGSADLLVASLLGSKRLSQDEITRMKERIKNWKSNTPQ